MRTYTELQLMETTEFSNFEYRNKENVTIKNRFFACIETIFLLFSASILFCMMTIAVSVDMKCKFADCQPYLEQTERFHFLGPKNKEI